MPKLSGWVIGLSLLLSVGAAVDAVAEEPRDADDQLIGGIISGLLGQPQTTQPRYTAQERDRLVSLLQSGEYVTSRQGESVDRMVYGVPLTHRDHVYTAKPIAPSQLYRPDTP